MSNYNKSFNFRNGVQVDEDDLIVRGSLVGIGTSVPRSALDVVGNVDVSGLVTSRNLFVSGIATFTDVRIGTGITIYGNAGIISATFSGDGSNLSNIPTSQWVDVNPGTGVTSIYAIGNVGIATTSPTNTLQVGGRVENGDSGVGISSAGNIRASGIVTASSFVGDGSALTALNASQITTGTISEDRLPESLNVTGVSTLGVTSFTGNVTFGADLLFGDNIVLRIGDQTNGDLKLYHDGSNSYIQDSGDGNLILRGDNAIILEQTDGSEKYAQFNKTGSVELYYDNAKKFETLGYGATVTGDLKVSNDIIVIGVATVGLISASDAHFSGVTTTGTLRATSGIITSLTISNNATLNNATVTNLNVTGITTVGMMTSPTAHIGVATVSVLNVTGLNAGVTTSTQLYTGNLQFAVSASGEIDTSTGILTLDSDGGTVQIDDDLIVTGNTYLTGITTVQDSILPDSDQDAALGSASLRFSDAYVDNIRIGVGSDNEISTGSGNLKLDSSSKLVEVADKFKVSGETYLTGITTVQNGLVPNADNGAFLGQSSKAFGEAYIDGIRIGVAASTTIDTRGGNLILDSSSKLVEVADKFKVSGETYLTGITTVQNSLLPDSDLGSTLGEAGKAFDGAHLDGIRVGVAASTTIDTRGGKLILDSVENVVEVTNDLKVNQVSNLLDDVYVGSEGNDLFVDSTLNRIGIGTSAPSNDLEVTRSGNLNVELVSETGTATVAIGQSLGIGNSSATISYANKDLSIANKDTGSINIEMSAGTGINTTSSLNVIHAGSTLISVGYSGVTGVNKANPEHALDVNGNLVVGGDAKITGIVTIGTGINEVTFGAPDATINANLIGNVYSDVGFSTFRNLDVEDVVSIGATLSVTGVGIGSFQTGVVIGSSNQLAEDGIGISPILNVSSGDLRVAGSALFSNSDSKVGVGTTGFLTDDRPSLAAEDSNFPGVNYGVMQLKGDLSVTGYSGGSSIFVAGPVGNTTAFLTYKDSRIVGDQNYQYSVGINTHVPRSCLDLGASASPLILPTMDAARKQYMIANPPASRINVYNASTGDANISGSLLFNTSTGRAELGIGNTGIMCGIATLTYNGSDHAAFLPPKMTTANRNAMTSSGIPDGAIIYNSSTDKLQLRAAGAWVDLN